MLLTDDQRTTRTIKYLNKEVELFVEFYAHKCKVNLTYKNIDDVTDVNDNQLWGIQFDGISIISNDTLDEFEVGHEVCIPGNYYEPDSSDYSEYSTHDNIHDALFDVVKLYWEWEYKNFLEYQWAEECVNEMVEE
jgi:hypothetical protein